MGKQTQEEKRLFWELYQQQKTHLKGLTKSVSSLSDRQKKLIIKKMFEKYEEFSASKKYIVGFIYEKQLYRITLSGKQARKYLTLDKASRGDGFSLRFSPTMDMKKALLKLGPEQMNITEDQFLKIVQKGAEDDFNKKRYSNKGLVFEKLITNLAKQSWGKDNIPFFKKGDINIGGEEFQIKFEGATYVTEKALLRLELKRAHNLLE